MEPTSFRASPDRHIRRIERFRRRATHDEDCSGVEVITDDQARKMIQDARWVSPRDFDELAICMPCGKRFVLIWPFNARPMLEEIAS
jgi:hypothetical protein